MPVLFGMFQSERIRSGRTPARPAAPRRRRRPPAPRPAGARSAQRTEHDHAHGLAVICDEHSHGDPPGSVSVRRGCSTTSACGESGPMPAWWRAVAGRIRAGSGRPGARGRGCRLDELAADDPSQQAEARRLVDGGGAVVDLELAQHVGDVGLHGLAGDVQACGDLGVGQAVGEAREHLTLAERQRVARCVLPGVGEVRQRVVVEHARTRQRRCGTASTSTDAGVWLRTIPATPARMAATTRWSSSDSTSITDADEGLDLAQLGQELEPGSGRAAAPP